MRGHDSMGYTDLVVKGQMNFMGIEIPVVSGGFGEDKMCVSDKTIAEIHGQPTYKIRQLINNNIKRFKDGIDIIDLIVMAQRCRNKIEPSHYIFAMISFSSSTDGF